LLLAAKTSPAIDEKLRRPVALKVLAAKYLVDDRNKELIFREARSGTSSPEHRNDLDVHDVPEAVFLTMELVQGESLRARIKRAPMPLDEALRADRARRATKSHSSLRQAQPGRRSSA
jgi:serine/threonine protein kinase